MRIVSKKLRDSARGQDCALRLPGCRHNPEYTVLCHLPVGMRGVGMKSPDLLRALAETQMRWVEMGLLVVKGAA
jgi:hypothetical protein